MKRNARWVVVIAVLALAGAVAAAWHSGAAADGARATWIYQGRLMETGLPADGSYDLQLQPFDAAEGGGPVGAVQEFADVGVAAGRFTVPLTVDQDGSYLEVRVRPSAGTGGWTTLLPRQQLPVWSDGSTGGSEVWRLGFTREGAGGYASLAGRVAAQVAAFRSTAWAGVEDKFFVFPAPATAKTVASARFHVLTRAGTAPAAADLTLEVYDLAGTLQRTVSAGSVDLASAPTGAWTTMALSGDQADCAVQPGEFLAFRCRVAPGGDLDIRPMFEVEVR